MKTCSLDISTDVEDTFLKNEGEWLATITSHAHRFECVELLFAEGVALEEIGYKGKKFLDVLKDLCKQNNWKLDKFVFGVVNLNQDKKVWPCIKRLPYPGHFLHGQKSQFLPNKKIDKTFGMFVGRSSWDRLLLSSHLYQNHSEKTIQTYRNYLDNPGCMINLDMDRLLWQMSAAGRLTKHNLQVILDFVAEIPFTIDDKWNNETHIQWYNGAWDDDFLKIYNHIFVDVVCEKIITGRAFFPTEKSGRPFVTKTPFIMMTSPNCLKNFRRLGFQTFNKYWDESYDYQQGMPRIESIKSIVNHLATLDMEKIRLMYKDMLPILEHNYKLYKELTTEKIPKVFDL